MEDHSPQPQVAHTCRLPGTCCYVKLPVSLRPSPLLANHDGLAVHNREGIEDCRGESRLFIEQDIGLGRDVNGRCAALCGPSFATLITNH